MNCFHNYEELKHADRALERDVNWLIESGSIYRAWSALLNQLWSGHVRFPKANTSRYWNNSRRQHLPGILMPQS